MEQYSVYGTLIPSGVPSGQGTGVIIRADSVTAASSGSIDASGWGFTDGPAYTSAGGGTHGGVAKYGSSGSVCGSATTPISLGSGGAHDSIQNPGGGAVKLVVSGQLDVQSSILANGDAGSQWMSGGGSGGSIWIDTGSLVGNGAIRANGGAAGNGDDMAERCRVRKEQLLAGSDSKPIEPELSRTPMEIAGGARREAGR